MPTHTRIIHKPAGLSPDQAGQLSAALAAALAAQRRLAETCRHILRPEGELTDSADHWSYRHEPADPLRPADLFIPATTPLSGPQLLGASYAIFEALRTAHDANRSAPVVHGAICPGVILMGQDQAWKIADFGILPALASVLGMDEALNLAVGPSLPRPESSGVSGVWSLLPATEVDRDDRICAFIDPEKYAQRLERGGRMPRDFSPRSDIISAGIVLHLLAEHHHPYLYEFDSAHRIPQMAEMVAGRMPTSARRRDLRESDLPGIREWCGLMPRILTHIPDLRPAAADVAAFLAPWVDSAATVTGAKSREQLELEQWLARLNIARAGGDLEAVRQLIDSPPTNELKSPEIAARVGALRAELAAHDLDRSMGEQDGGAATDVLTADGPLHPAFKRVRAVLSQPAIQRAAARLRKIARPATRLFPPRLLRAARPAAAVGLAGLFIFALYSFFIKPGEVKPPGESKGRSANRGGIDSRANRIAAPTRGDRRGDLPVVRTYKLMLEPPGSVTAEPNKVEYSEGERVTITAHPASGHRFDRWSGDESGTDQQISVRMDGNKTVQAIYVQQYRLTQQKDGQGTVSPNPSQPVFDTGSTVTLTAKAEEGWHFNRWDGDVEGAGAETPLTLNMNQDRSVKAVFAKNHVLNVDKDPPEAGDVLKDPEAASYPPGRNVILTAVPNVGWGFLHWDDDKADTSNVKTIPMTADRTLKATFTRSGWPTFDPTAERAIKISLKAQSPYLADWEADWIGLQSAGAKLTATLKYPWGDYEWLKMKSLPIDVPFPDDTWPADKNLQPAAAAKAIGEELRKKVEADPLLDNVIRYAAFWKERRDLEVELSNLPSVETGKPMSLAPEKFGSFLARVTRIKWLSQAPPAPVAMLEWSKYLQDTLLRNRGQPAITREILPIRFIEFFWGPQFLHALYWFADDGKTQTLRYLRVGESNEIGRNLAAMLPTKGLPANPILGDQLLGAILDDSGVSNGGSSFFAVNPSNATFGVAWAPDGPLCFLPIALLRFSARSAKFEVTYSNDPGLRCNLDNLTGLSELFGWGSREDTKFKKASTAGWIMVSLGPAPPNAETDVPWRIPCQIYLQQKMGPRKPLLNGLDGDTSVRNGDVLFMAKDANEVQQAVWDGIKAVQTALNSRVSRRTEWETMDVGFVGPRVEAYAASKNAPWFAIVADPVASPSPTTQPGDR